MDTFNFHILKESTYLETDVKHEGTKSVLFSDFNNYFKVVLPLLRKRFSTPSECTSLHIQINK